MCRAGIDGRRIKIAGAVPGAAAAGGGYHQYALRSQPTVHNQRAYAAPAETRNSTTLQEMLQRAAQPAAAEQAAQVAGQAQPSHTEQRLWPAPAAPILAQVQLERAEPSLPAAFQPHPLRPALYGAAMLARLQRPAPAGPTPSPWMQAAFQPEAVPAAATAATQPLTQPSADWDRAALASMAPRSQVAGGGLRDATRAPAAANIPGTARDQLLARMAAQLGAVVPVRAAAGGAVAGPAQAALPGALPAPNSWCFAVDVSSSMGSTQAWEPASVSRLCVALATLVSVGSRGHLCC